MAGMPKRGGHGAVAWEGDLTSPVTSYAASVKHTALLSGLNVPATSNRTNSAVVDRRDTRGRLLAYYSHGGVVMPAPSVPTPGAGGVRNSVFQQVLVQLHDWHDYRSLFMAGYPQNLGLSFRVGQLQTNVNGGPGVTSMDTKPVFAGVQVVPRATASFLRYRTRAAKS